MEAYAKSATSIDYSVGRVLQALDTAGVADNTLVIYTSDHGYSLGELKYYAYEHIMRIPMIVKYPGRVVTGVEKRDMVLAMDIGPTVLDWCDVKVPREMDGKSWEELFKNEDPLTDRFRDDFFYDFYHYMGEQRLPAMQAVRTATHKLIEYERKHFRELYDLKADPHELDNRIDDPAYANVLADLEKRLKRLKKESGWSPRVIQPLKDYYFLGSFTAKEDSQVFPALQDGPFSLKPLTLAGKRFTWAVQHQAENWISLPRSTAGPSYAYIGLPVERLAQEDPCFQIWSYLPGMELEENRTAPAIAGFMNGRCWFESLEYAEVEGRKGFPHRFFNRFNPPLRKGDNLIWMRVIVPQGEGNHRFRIDMLYPTGTLDFELEHQ
ncbi:MAG: sulfatase/phosphatase domain-containing protein [Pirellulales bacterium]